MTNRIRSILQALRVAQHATVLALAAIVLACGAPVPEAQTEAEGPIELGQLEQQVIYNGSYLPEGYGILWPQGARCFWPWETCVVPKFKAIKIRIMPHDYDGCWGNYWTDAMQRAITGWNQAHIAFQTGFQLQVVSSGEHARIWCKANHCNNGADCMGSTEPLEEECSQWSWDDWGWTEGLCKAKKWNIRLAGNGIVGLGYNDNGIENIVRHELGHLFGLAHNSGSALMNSPATPAYYNASIRFPTTTELDNLWGYCPTGSSPGCG